MKSVFIPELSKSISSIGLGCVTFGREINEASSYELMDFAYENGITLFDTAASYGEGASEEIVGRWLGDRHSSAKEKVIVSTKIRPPYTPENIVFSVEQCLNRLNKNCIEILYLHSWDYTIEFSNALKALDDLIELGKVKMLGVSNFNAEQLRKIIHLQKIHGFSVLGTIQNNNNVAIRDITDDIVEICLAQNIKIVSYSPLGAGFLTGKYNRGVEEGSRFSVIPEHKGIYFNQTSLSRLKKLEEFSLLTGYTTTDLALSWAMHKPFISSVLVGGRSIQHLIQAFKAQEFNNQKVLEQLDSIY
ncbi:MAG: aldo/keto reductase [Ginsengibacter sp.]